MRLRIVCYEDPDVWICGKIARRLTEALVALGHSCTLGESPDSSADVNHHVIYLHYPGHTSGLHTLMVTHIDDALKLRRLQKGLITAKAAVCMSSDGVKSLAALGVEKTKLQHVNMAHDGKAKEKRFVVGITTRLYPDGRKREADIVRLLEFISPRDFAFKIMGFGWAPIVAKARQRGFEIEYHEEFNYDRYIEMLSTLEYYMYLGRDEGSAGFIDALAAGVKTIVVPQGHHLDAKNGITHAVTTFEELKNVFLGLAAEKAARIDAVREWTWQNYAKKHLAIWEQCIQGVPLHDCLAEESATGFVQAAFPDRIRLWKNVFWNRFKMVMNIRKDFHCESRLWQRRRERSRSEK
jgi:hypothetical protein